MLDQRVQRVQHDGYHNTYSFTKDGYKVVLKPMHSEEFSKKPKRVELMTRNGAVDYLGQGRPILFAKGKEKHMEDDDEFELSFVEGLDSKMSLSQPGVNDVNP